MKFWLTALAAKSPEIYIYDEVGSPWAADPVTMSSVRDKLNAIGESPELVIRINSVGGSVTEGMAIYSALREFAGKKTVVVEGLAASIASVIAMAGDEVVMTRGSYMMVHNPFAVAQGEASDLRRTADLLDKMRSEMLAIYQARTKLPMSDIEALVDAETYLSAEDAVAKGFADRVSDTGARIAASAVKLLTKPPEALQKAALAKDKNMTEEECKKMQADLAASKEECEALKAKLAKFEKSDDDGDDEDEESSSGDGESAKASVRMARVVLAASEAYGETDPEKLEGLIKAGAPSASSGKGTRKEIVREAMKAGKVPPALKDWAMTCPRAALDSFLKAAPSHGPGAPAHREPAPEATSPAAPTLAELKVARAFGTNRTEEDNVKRAVAMRAVPLVNAPTR